MATSVEEICNLALFRLGVKQAITSIDEESTEAVACNLVYAQSRDVILEAYPWPFAMRHEVLAALDVDDRDDWAFTYSLPVDCVTPRYIWAGTRNPSREDLLPFTTESSEDLDSEVLLTDVDEAELFYTARVTNPTRFAPSFVDALAWRLAAELVVPLTGKAEKVGGYLQMSQTTINIAKARALQAQQKDVAPQSPGILVRG